MKKKIWIFALNAIVLCIFAFLLTSCGNNAVRGTVVNEQGELDIMPQKLLEEVGIGDTATVRIGLFKQWEMPLVEELIPEDGKLQLVLDREKECLRICVYNGNAFEECGIRIGDKVNISATKSDSDPTESDLIHGDPSDSQTAFIPQSEKDTYKEKLTAVLSAVKYADYTYGLGSFASFGAGLMDLNFDNVPEVLVAAPGGSMGNVCITVYDLETGEEMCGYNAAHYGDWDNIYMCVAAFDGDYVILTEGSYREPSIGFVKTFGVLDQALASDYLSGKILFAESVDASHYEYNGESVSKEEYTEQFQKFTEEYVKIDETQIIIVKWSDVGFDNEKSDGSDIDVYAEKLAEALLHSGQEFIAYQK